MCDAQIDVSACLSIPCVPGFALGDWEATEKAMKTGVRLDFGQPWCEVLQPDFKPGQVWLGVVGDELAVYAVMEDDQPANRATAWNDPTWMTGDALEFFFQAEGRPGYFEFHVTPENVRLQLFFPSRAAFAERRGHRPWAIPESRFESAVRINPTRTGWEAVMRIKLPLVLDEPRTDGSRRFRYSFSRYDYQPGRELPVVSATTPLVSGPHFHNIDEWSWAEAARG
ncbi:MAG: hypothetical protein WC205_12335 [Opitutaceae bacterium]|jgi:hypothetical protein